ncbi:hypothetical protein C8A03DRAFT_43012 [Achaetomium macrosporum]|uniref:Uncharacterized protein n=1 Tax=Achaetomium macrosporum TaxID=79813 RepID=A0AAN7CD36_9PEZI|nr:hypothetical protein C8A03DRAFT_43012 [Achaetomium macrosporum]
MDTMMPMGFVGNTREIYAEVASYPVVPPEKIKQYWTAYTTTFRRLSDPRAFRLENFWFHVWASERLRNLSGPTLAKLFEEFSNGPTLVPLPSPVGRYAGTKTSGPGQRRTGEHNPEAAQRHRDRSGQGSAPAEIRKAPTPSSSRPPPPHPILKKTRGPSVSGRRPTARFVLPLGSGDEAGQDGGAIPTSTAASASEMPPHSRPSSAEQNEIGVALTAPTAINETPSPQELHESTCSPAPRPVVSQEEMRPSSTSPATTGRKIVATTAASRKKPVIVRRPSSQSSAGSDSGSRVTGFVTGSRRSGSRRPIPTPSQLLGPGSLSPQTRDLGMSAKAAGKRPAKIAASNRSSPQGAAAQVGRDVEEAVVAQEAQPDPGLQRRSTWDMRDSITSQEAAQRRQAAVRLVPRAQPSAPVAGFVVDQTSGYGAPPLLRSHSSNAAVPPRLREPGVAVLPSEATSSVATSTATARGQFDSETVTLEPFVPEARDIPDRVLFASQPSSSVLHPKFTPTPPNPTSPIPFGRSRSELTLLLERAKSRKHDGS